MQDIPKIETKRNPPTTPEMHHGKIPELADSPSSVYSMYSPMTPTSPSTPSRLDWSAIVEARNAGDTPLLRNATAKSLGRQTSLLDHTVLSRQASLSRNSSLRNAPPSKVGDLTVGRQIGSGSFSKIYEAYGKQGVYAMKIRLSSTPEEVFSSEMAVLAKLQKHATDNTPIVRFFDELSDEDHCVLKMYTGSLEALVKSPKYHVDENSIDFFDYRIMSQPVCGLQTWCSWARQLIDGLRYIHSQNVVHADLKPDNVLIGDDGALVISDFSGAFDLDQLHPSAVLHGEIRDGFAWSPVFTDPQLRSGKSVPSFGSDIYALGLVLAFCATGQEPFSTAKNATQRLLWMDKISPLESFEMDVMPRLKLVKPIIELLLRRTWDGVDQALETLLAST